MKNNLLMKARRKVIELKAIKDVNKLRKGKKQNCKTEKGRT